MTKKLNQFEQEYADAKVVMLSQVYLATCERAIMMAKMESENAHLRKQRDLLCIKCATDTAIAKVRMMPEEYRAERDRLRQERDEAIKPIDAQIRANRATRDAAPARMEERITKIRAEYQEERDRIRAEQLEWEAARRGRGEIPLKDCLEALMVVRDFVRQRGGDAMVFPFGDETARVDFMAPAEAEPAGEAAGTVADEINNQLI